MERLWDAAPRLVALPRRCSATLCPDDPGTCRGRRTCVGDRAPPVRRACRQRCRQRESLCTFTTVVCITCPQLLHHQKGFYRTSSIVEFIQSSTIGKGTFQGLELPCGDVELWKALCCQHLESLLRVHTYGISVMTLRRRRLVIRLQFAGLICCMPRACRGRKLSHARLMTSVRESCWQPRAHAGVTTHKQISLQVKYKLRTGARCSALTGRACIHWPWLLGGAGDQALDSHLRYTQQRGAPMFYHSKDETLLSEVFRRARCVSVVLQCRHNIAVH